MSSETHTREPLFGSTPESRDDTEYISGVVIPLDGGMGRFLDLGEEYRVYDPYKGLKK